MSRHYHFIGIGGIGMGPLALLTLARGNKVSGSDLKESPLTLRLREQGATIRIGHAESHIESPDVVVYSSAVAQDNPEIVAAKNKNIQLVRRAQILAELANTQTSVTVAGAHGKTTTTAMIASLLLKAGLKPTTLVGGIIDKETYNACLGDGKYVVTEVDESDGSFLYFHPTYSVITNIDFEHVDYYHNWENILTAYRQFISQIAPEGFLIIWGEDKNLRQLSEKAPCQVWTYGLDKDCDLIACNIKASGFETSFDCKLKGKKLGRIDLKIPGTHNILNALAATALCLKLGLEFKVISKGLSEYYGVQRRFQVKARGEGTVIVDDYGHHPTEIAATLRTAQSLKEKRLVTVFQPHRYSRTKYLLNELAESLALSDYLIITDIYAASEPPIEGVSADVLLEKTRNFKKNNLVYLTKGEVVPHLLKIIKKGDLILTLGAGDITRLGDDLINSLKNQGNAIDAAIEERVV